MRGTEMDILSDLIKNITFTQKIEKDAYNFLEYHGYKEIAEHCCKVADEAEKPNYEEVEL